MKNQNEHPQTASIPEAGMLRSLNELRGHTVEAQDGSVGSVHDFLFDDEFWIVRYLVVDTGNWLPGRKVLLPPVSLREPDWEEQCFRVALTRKEVEDSPDINTDLPISRHREAELHTHYTWPFYWPAFGAAPVVPPPHQSIPRPDPDPDPDPEQDFHLRSIREVTRYNIEASDGEIGCVDDFIADDEYWGVRYLVVATRKWLPGRKVLIAPQWLVGPIDWDAQTVKVLITREQIKTSPLYDPATPINRDQENRLYDYYGRPRGSTSAPT